MTNIPAVGWNRSSGAEALDRTSGPKQKGTSGSGDTAEALKSSAQEFEALFLGYMLSVMRTTIGESDLTEKGLGQSTYTELFDQEVARSLAKRGALGISDLLIRNLTQQVVSPELEIKGSTGPRELLPEESGRSVSPGLPQKGGRQ